MKEQITGTAKNTDRILWSKDEANPFSDSLRITEDGRIGITHDCLTVILPFETWSELGLTSLAVPAEPSLWRYLVRWWRNR